MSARVFNPMVMSEMRRMLSAYENNPRPNRSTSSPPDTSDLARVRRDLFGPVDHEDNRRFVERELATQQDRDNDRWGFDFVRETPRKSGPGTARYAWEKVTPDETVPEPYALRRLPCLQNATVEVESPVKIAEEESTPEDLVARDETETNTVGLATTVAKSPPVLQTRMTDYLRVKKRNYTSSSPKPKNTTSGGRPKQARTAPS